MDTIKLPSITHKKCHEEAAARYESSYSRDYYAKEVVERVPRRPASVSRKHNPHPRHVFLLRRMFNEPVCNVWTKQSSVTATASRDHRPPKSSAQCSYPPPTCVHPNFIHKPTRFHSNGRKPNTALGIVPAVNVIIKGHNMAAADNQVSEPLSMDIKGKKRVISAAYVLDQQLPQFSALEDMKCRARGSLEFYLSHAIKRPSRRKHINTRPTCLMGSSIKVKETAGDNTTDGHGSGTTMAEQLRPLMHTQKVQPIAKMLPPCTCVHKLTHALRS